jgi:HNH endonuclease
MITSERLRELLHYDPEMDVFTRRVRTANCVKVGDVAGDIDRLGYRRINVNGSRYRAHRLAWLYITGEWPAGLDHVNGNRSDNRWCNLREATQSQNNANTPMREDNTSGFKGVSWNKHACKWDSRIHVNDRQLFLGLFATPERAFLEYCFAAWRHFGDFARIDADYLVALRRLKARKEFETRVLWNLANPDYLIAA